MSREIRYGPHEYYKGKFFIVFYDKSDENLKYMFNNAREILNFLGKECSRANINRINVEIYLALKREGHFTRMLRNELLRVYIIDLDD